MPSISPGPTARAPLPRAARATARVAALAAALALAGCGGGGSSSDVPRDDPVIGENGTYLFLSQPRFYFGTREVGTSRTDTVEIQNRGADAYPLKSIALAGDDLDDFRIPFYGEITLQPAQAIRVPITFAPFADGRKYASLEIDYETITLVDESVNVAEQAYYRGRDQARDGDYVRARRTWSEYLASDPVTVNERRAAVRMPVAKEASTYAEGEDATLYLEALDARDRDAPAEALEALDRLLERHGEGYLADDATYLRGYVALMDMDDPEAALREFDRLAERFPDSTYRDTALYAEAIAQDRLGNARLAIDLYTELRDRHTGLDALGVRLARDELESRLWFARADRALEALGAG